MKPINVKRENVSFYENKKSLSNTNKVPLREKVEQVDRLRMYRK